MFLRYNLFTILWAGIIFLLILMPGQQFPELGNLFSFDKMAHLGVFSILCLLMIIGFSKQFSFLKIRKYSVRYSLLISLTYAAILEAGQVLIPDRSANFFDMAFNTMGVLFGYLIFFLVYKFSFE